MTIPQEFIEAGLKEVRTEIISNSRRYGVIFSEDYYTSIAAAKVWYCLVKRKNSDSSQDNILRTGDIKSACRILGLDCRDDKGDLYVNVSGHTFFFSNILRGIYGGPCDGDGYYQGYSIKETDLKISTKALIKLMLKMCTIYEVLRIPVNEYIHKYVLQSRTIEIMETTMKSQFEPELEDVLYRYRCYSDDTGESVGIWLYHKDDVSNEPPYEITLFNIVYSDLLDNVEYYKKVIRDIYYGTMSWYEYKGLVSAKGLPYDDIPFGRPTLDTPKLF